MKVQLEQDCSTTTLTAANAWSKLDQVTRQQSQVRQETYNRQSQFLLGKMKCQPQLHNKMTD